ncbi:polysaccharide deacetylase family protein [Lederbergia wuyishanensis]|uniref:Sporulation protein (Polysaccharide deacetylase family) n=1 Tax=Lederbergia wuyishanensis TaxID=1347903 RepID=A0ABU0CZW4_9BACI|nr:polysaccharide deacetylase family protein [Lederbergia wuyishanensis]MCJ8006313.1 polysaccharide deacetylase family protein [Lederbergia wuyishanensis]MDQ0341682.1 putative sporulation protein (polysaccharide deacetylase family) [Lederbergia wuyishanensis]
MFSSKNLIALVLIAILSLSAIFNPYTNQYVKQLQSNSIFVSKHQGELYDLIIKAADYYQIEPQNAKIDRVWKAMPGYNGIKVDIEASYQKMKKDNKYDEKKLVFIQIQPDVHLSDLPPSPIYRGHPEKPMVSFLINVAWGNEYIPSMLATLKKNKVHATFFLEGRWAKENPELTKMIADGGHEIGNHSYSHPNMQVLSAAETRQELSKTNEIIEATTGKKVTWFGPPAGAFRKETIDIAHSLNLRTVMWTVDTIDWQKPSTNVLIQRVTSKVHPGAMILMHPTEPTDKALQTLISEIKSRNLRFGTVSKLMDEERIIKLYGQQNMEQERSNP